MEYPVGKQTYVFHKLENVYFAANYLVYDFLKNINVFNSNLNK